jgi:hypothetical protein
MEFLETIYDNANKTRNRWNWLPILMWLEAFVTTVFLVNLMSTRRTLHVICLLATHSSRLEADMRARAVVAQSHG